MTRGSEGARAKRSGHFPGCGSLLEKRRHAAAIFGRRDRAPRPRGRAQLRPAASGRTDRALPGALVLASSQ